mmetsp:Transcript_2169/g.4997  ORF Transcript_2169/g.4997 Transcript_2169/m.4997 type:complete len:200 (+) Transcript_2169:930-1529(+)
MAVDSGYPSRFVEFFGPCTWKVLHSVAWSYPLAPTSSHQSDYKNFLEAIGNVLPCPNCRTHFKSYLKKSPPDMKSRESLARWVYDAQNQVNRRNNKPIPKFEDVKAHYSGWANGQMPAAMQSSSRNEQLAFMASPYMKESPQSALLLRNTVDGELVDAGEGEGVFVYRISLGVLALFLIAALGLAYYFYRKSRKETNKN